MVNAGCALLNDATASLPGADLEATGSKVTRYGPSKMTNGSSRFVIVDVDANGQEEWADQAPGEVRWYTFTPSWTEREAVRGRFMNGAGRPRSSLLLIEQPATVRWIA